MRKRNRFFGLVVLFATLGAGFLMLRCPRDSSPSAGPAIARLPSPRPIVVPERQLQPTPPPPSPPPPSTVVPDTLPVQHLASEESRRTMSEHFQEILTLLDSVTDGRLPPPPNWDSAASLEAARAMIEEECNCVESFDSVSCDEFPCIVVARDARGSGERDPFCLLECLGAPEEARSSIWRLPSPGDPDMSGGMLVFPLPLTETEQRWVEEERNKHASTAIRSSVLRRGSKLWWAISSGQHARLDP